MNPMNAVLFSVLRYLLLIQDYLTVLLPTRDRWTYIYTSKNWTIYLDERCSNRASH